MVSHTHTHKNMLAVRNNHNHGSMGRMLSASVVARGIANRVTLPVNTATQSSYSSSSSSESSGASAYESGGWESSRAEVAQRMAPPQRRGNITSSNGLVLPWANGTGCTIVTTSSTRIPAAPAVRDSGKKKKKRPGLPVSLNLICDDLSKGINPSEFVQNVNPMVNNAVATTNISNNEPRIIHPNGNERSRVQAMLANQKAGSSSGSDNSSSSSSSSARKRNRISKKSATKSRKKRRKTTTPPRQRSGNPSSNEDIAEDEFFQQNASGSSGSSSSSSSSSDDEDCPNLYRVRRNQNNVAGAGATGPANPRVSSRNLCFGCMWGHRQFDRVASTKLNRLAEIFDSHFLTSEPRELAHLIYLYYQAEIYLPGSKGGKRFPVWTEGQILIHIEEHILEPRVFVAKSIRKCIKVQRALEMFFFEEDEQTHRRTYNEKAMRLWLMFNKRQMDLHNCDCKHMFGYSESMRIDPSQLSRVVHADRYEVVGNSNKRGRSNIYS